VLQRFTYILEPNGFVPSVFAVIVPKFVKAFDGSKNLGGVYKPLFVD